MHKSSAVLIQEMLARFAAAHALKFPDDRPVSQRKVSGWISKTDPNLLARWTNEKGHESHSEWRIPLFRVQQLCKILEASEAEHNLLMATRVEEAIAYDKCRDALAVVEWLRPLLEEALARPALSSLEHQVVTAFRSAQDKSPVGQYLPSHSELEEELEASMQNWVGRTVEAHVAQEIAETALEEELTSEAKDVAFQKKRQRVLAMLKARGPAAGPPRIAAKRKEQSAAAALSKMVAMRSEAQGKLESKAAVRLETAGPTLHVS